MFCCEGDLYNDNADVQWVGYILTPHVKYTDNTINLLMKRGSLFGCPDFKVSPKQEYDIGWAEAQKTFEQLNLGSHLLSLLRQCQSCFHHDQRTILQSRNKPNSEACLLAASPALNPLMRPHPLWTCILDTPWTPAIFYINFPMHF